MQYTLYIRKNVNEKFSKEVDKSRLVNELLCEHYGMDGVGERTTSTVVQSKGVSPSEPVVRTLAEMIAEQAEEPEELYRYDPAMGK